MSAPKSGADVTAPEGAPEATSAPSPWELLRAPFPESKIGKLPRGTIANAEWKKLPRGRCTVCKGWHATTSTIHLDFVGHADVTDRLLSVDPSWNWEPLSMDASGLPMFVLKGGSPAGLWIKLTVAGVTRLGYGTVEPGAFDAEKQLIGDALRNAAMRFGVGLDLWRKEVDSEAPPADTASTEATAGSTLPPARSNGNNRAAAPATTTAPPASTGTTPRAEKGEPCPFCFELGIKSRKGETPFFWTQGGVTHCNGFEGGEFVNHRLPAPVTAGGDVNPDDIPF